MIPDDINLTGATIIQVAPGDRLTFVVNHDQVPEEVLYTVQEWFPGLIVSMVTGCAVVIHEPQAEHLSVSSAA